MTKILIGVDMQKDFVDGALGTPEAVAIVDRAVRKIEEFEGDIYATYDTHTEDYLASAEGKNLPVVHCVKDTEGWQLNAAVQAALDKRDYGTVEKVTSSLDVLPTVANLFGLDADYAAMIGHDAFSPEGGWAFWLDGAWFDGTQWSRVPREDVEKQKQMSQLILADNYFAD